MFGVYKGVFKDTESFPGVFKSYAPTPYCLTRTTPIVLAHTRAQKFKNLIYVISSL